MVITEHEKKTFIKNSIHLFSLFDEKRFISFYLKMLYIINHNSTIIYTENNKADKFYLIYSGEYAVFKNEYNDLRSKDTIQMKNLKMLKLNKGSFAGLEAVTNDNHNYKTYQNSLKVPTNNNITLVNREIFNTI